MKQILDFIEKHKKFFKKLLLFIIYILIISIVNSEPVLNMFNNLFGEYMASMIRLVTPFVLISTEV